MEEKKLYNRGQAEHVVRTEKSESYLKKILMTEQVLGIILTPQQLHYIATGRWRRSGKTTAYIIKMLLEDEPRPLDFRKREVVEQYMDESFREYAKFFKRETKEIYDKLKTSCVDVRQVLF